MAESELQLYIAYAEKKPLPNKVLELQIAQVSQSVLNMASTKNNYKISDFLLHEPKVEKPPMTEREAAILYGFDVEAYEKKGA
jgi:hypothetical protein